MSEDKSRLQLMTAELKLETMEKLEVKAEEMLSLMEDWSWVWVDYEDDEVVRWMELSRPGYCEVMEIKMRRVRQMCGLMEAWLQVAQGVPPSGNGADDDEDIKVGGTA